MAGAMAGAHCATREDAMGTAARRAGSVVVRGAERAKRSGEAHAERLATRVADTRATAAEGAAEVTGALAANAASFSTRFAEAQAALVSTSKKLTEAFAGISCFTRSPGRSASVPAFERQPARSIPPAPSPTDRGACARPRRQQLATKAASGVASEKTRAGAGQVAGSRQHLGAAPF